MPSYICYLLYIEKVLILTSYIIPITYPSTSFNFQVAITLDFGRGNIVIFYYGKENKKIQEIF